GRRPRSRRSRRRRRRAGLLLGHPRQDPIAETTRQRGRGVGPTEREQGRYLTILLHLALGCRRGREERLEPSGLVGRERAERIGGGEVLGRVLPRAGHVPRSK